MLQIRREQIEALETVPRDVFVRKMAAHLERMRRTVNLQTGAFDNSQESLERLRDETRCLMDHGFENESDIAAAIEYFELFGVEFDSEKTLEALSRQGRSVSEKLDALWDLRQG